MRGRGNRFVVGALLLPLLSAFGGGTQAPPTPSATPEPQPAETFVERLDVTATELMIDVRDRQGRLVLGLGPDDFEVTEDDKPMKVIGVDYPPVDPVVAAAQAAASTATATAEAPPEWRFLIYFDLVLTQKRAVRLAADLLADRVDELVAMGAVELVVANPRPEILVPFTRDPKSLRQELGAVAKLAANHQLASIRRDFLHALDMRLNLASQGPSAAVAVRNQIRSSVEREFLLLNRRLIVLGQWIGAYGHVPASAAIVVSDGFDMNPAEFYLSATSIPGIEEQLSLDLNRYRVDPLTGALADEMSARGWTGIMVSLGGVSELSTTDASGSYRDRFRSIGEGELSAGPESGSPISILRNPQAPLLLVSDKTGGELMTTRKTAGRALERVGERIRLTYLAERPSDGVAHRVTVRTKSPGLTVKAPRWVRSPTREQTAAARARRLLMLSTDGGELPVRVAVGALTPGADKDTRRAEVEIFFDLDMARPVLPDPIVPMAFTFGVDIPEAPPLVYEITQSVTLPGDDTLDDWPEFLYRVVLDLPVKARRLSLVVEEPQSGIWGGTVREIGRETRPSGSSTDTGR